MESIGKKCLFYENEIISVMFVDCIRHSAI